MTGHRTLTLVQVLLLSLGSLVFITADLQALKRNGAGDFIVLAGDFHPLDDYITRAKGLIFNIRREARVIEGPRVKPGDRKRLARMLVRVASDYPKGTIFVATLNPTHCRRALLLKTITGLFFVIPDNGLIDPIIDKYGIEELRELTNPKFFRYSQKLSGSSDLIFDVVIPVAGHLCRGIDPQSLGQKSVSYKKLHLPRCQIVRNGIRGHIALIDNYGNWITNIHKKQMDFFKIAPGNLLLIQVKGINLLFPFFENIALVPPGSRFCYRNSNARLVFSLNGKSLNREYQQHEEQPILIKLNSL